MTKKCVLLVILFVTESLELNPVSLSVRDKGLLSSTFTVKDVLSNCDEYSRETETKGFPGPILGYVTPWNSHGYDVAKVFRHKFDLLSPVWLQLTPDLEIHGTHDIDSGWIRDVRPSRIVPRVIFDRWRAQDYMKLFDNVSKIQRIGRILSDLCDKHGFGGIVLEVWSQLGGQARKELSTVIQGISKVLRSQKGRILILVIPPAVYHGEEQGYFNKQDFDRLYKDVDYFSLMTYDYSNPHRPGPNSPIKWVRNCVELLSPDGIRRNKILLGLNFYGLTYTADGGRHVIRSDFKRILNSTVDDSSPFKWNEDYAEHSISIKLDGVKNTVYYPSLFSVHRRIRLAEELETGISIWEIGQGLDYFYDLL